MKYLLSLFFCIFSYTVEAIPLAIVSHHWITKIVDSRNNVTIRPGSVYDIQTYFEQIKKGKTPKFKYIFRDTGLGAAEPIYPIFQVGYQTSWKDVIKAGISRKHLHIDHYSEVYVPEGCTVYSAYWVRHVNDYPELYKKEKELGYTLIDIGFDYYEQTIEGAKCGKHLSYPPVPGEKNPINLIKKYAKKFKTYDDIPNSLLEKLESKIGILKLVKEKFSFTKWPRYKKVYKLKDNSMWYYPGVLEKDYGIKTSYQSLDQEYKLKPSDYFIEGSDFLQKEITLNKLLIKSDIDALFLHLSGKPTGKYNSSNEPGLDSFSLNQISTKNIWTSGLKLWPIKNAKKIIHNLDNFKLVSIIVRPYEPEPDFSFKERIIPQLRFVFQLVDPKRKLPLEQAYLHIQFDANDRYADLLTRNNEHRNFLKSYEKLIQIKNINTIKFNNEILKFINTYTKRKVQTIAYSSSLTGIWVFGSLSRSFNKDNLLQSVRFKRKGIDVGYYSTIWDNALFRNELKKSKGKRKSDLKKHMSFLRPKVYRDQKRQDVSNITFNKMTCAQCHQMSGRDGVHITLNDATDDRIKTKSRKTEFALREIDRQLKFGESYWDD